MPSWRFAALGPPNLAGPTSLVPEKKTAAVLLYLALEGQTPRSRLAGLLWPDSSESAARNNLSQTLRRLRLATQDSLIVGDDMLRASPELEVDAAAFKVAAFSGDAGTLLAAQGELLKGYDYDDCPEFSDWLYSEREALREAHLRALENLSEKAQAEGDLKGAVRMSERVLELDPLAEGSYRRLMTLNYLSGDRSAAMRVYQRCRDVLKRELGVEPLPQTEDLARRIERGQVSPPERPKREIPLELLRPPVVVGRDSEWARLEEAWDAGQAIFVSGGPGVGKSRLLRDFALGKGPHLLFEGRPGDAALPYATQARVFRETLAAFPDLTLEPWARTELARILPELGGDAGPIHSQAEKLRFFEAMAWVFRQLARRGPLVTLFDDLQYGDAASLEALRYLYSSLSGEGGLRALFAFRSGELPEGMLESLAAQVSAAQAVHLELAPLDGEATRALLETLSVGGAALGQPILRYTGGNPLFILETVRHLFETARLEQPFPERLPPPGKAGMVIRRRLEGLSGSAQRVAQAAAVLQGELEPGLVAQLLESDPLALIPAWEELERQHITAGTRFSHDLMLETVRASIPEPVRGLLHERAHKALQAQNAPSARLAHHAEGAGRFQAALRHHLEAARRAAHVFALALAADHYRRAQRLLEEDEALAPTLTPEELRDLYYQLGFIYVYTNAFAEAKTLYLQGLKLAREAHLPQLEWLVLNHLAYLAVHDGYNLQEAERHAEAALEVAEGFGDERLLVEAHQEIAGLYTLAFLPEKALRHAEEALLVAERQHDPELTARSLMEIEIAAWQLGQAEDAIRLLERAAELYRESGNEALEARARHSLAFDQIAAGRARAGAENALAALRLSRNSQARREEVNALGVLALARREQGLLGEARRHAEASADLARSLGVAVLEVLALRRLALLQLDGYDLEGADATLRRAETLNATLARRPREGEIAALRSRHARLAAAPERAMKHARNALASRDLREAEPWVERWPLALALREAEDAEALSRLRELCRALLPKSPRHRLEALRSLALAGASRREGLEEALALAETLELPQEQRRDHLLLAEVLSREGRPREAARHCAEAQRLQDKLGATLTGAARETYLAGATRELGLWAGEEK